MRPVRSEPFTVGAALWTLELALLRGRSVMLACHVSRQGPEFEPWVDRDKAVGARTVADKAFRSTCPSGASRGGDAPRPSETSPP
jgi:hypothetical protein